MEDLALQTKEALGFWKANTVGESGMGLENQKDRKKVDIGDLAHSSLGNKQEVICVKFGRDSGCVLLAS